MKWTCTDVATAALDQPGGEGWAYDREDEDWQRLTLRRQMARGSGVPVIDAYLQ